MKPSQAGSGLNAVHQGVIFTQDYQSGTTQEHFSDLSFWIIHLSCTLVLYKPCKSDNLIGHGLFPIFTLRRKQLRL